MSIESYPSASGNVEKPMMVHKEQIPQDLLSYPQWVCWRYVDCGAGKKPTKQPINPRTLHNAGVNWPNTWTSFEQAYATYVQHAFSGVGFVLTAEDPFVGFDLDRCWQAGQFSAQAQAVMDQLASYTELSPSGAGLRILVAAPDFGQNVRKPTLEVYAHSRFLTVTGHHLPGTPDTIMTVDAELIQALVPSSTSVARSHQISPGEQIAYQGDDRDLWERIFQVDRFGAQHRQRFEGDLSLDGADHSMTVLRILNCLARWTGGDADRMRKMMLMSPLANEKWFSKRGTRDWLDYQIEDAIRYVKWGR